jgi:hypothetical protein
MNMDVSPSFLASRHLAQALLAATSGDAFMHKMISRCAVISFVAVLMSAALSACGDSCGLVEGTACGAKGDTCVYEDSCDRVEYVCGSEGTWAVEKHTLLSCDYAAIVDACNGADVFTEDHSCERVGEKCRYSDLCETDTYACGDDHTWTNVRHEQDSTGCEES